MIECAALKSLKQEILIKPLKTAVKQKSNLNMKNMKTNRFHSAARRAPWGAGIAIAAIIAASGVNAFAAFTAGNLIIDREGRDSGAPYNTGGGTPIYLDQYTTSGTLVNTTAIPTNGANAFLNAGNSTLEGHLTVTPDGTKLVLAGYNIPYGAASAITASNAVAVPRAAATVDYNGNFTLAVVDNAIFGGTAIRSAASDGSGNFWAAGGAQGQFYMATGQSNNISATVVNTRQIQYIGGNLYYSTGSGTPGIYEISGAPTVAGANTAVNILNEPGSPYGYAFDPWMATCYLADADPFASTNTAGKGGVEKYIYNGSSWVYQYSIAPPPTGSNNVYSVAVDWTAMPPKIYGLTTNLFSVQDTGPGAVAVSLATNASSTIFRFLAFAPSSSGLPAAAPTITGISPASPATNVGGGTVTFALTGTTGSPIASNFWYKISGGATNLIAGAIANTLTFATLVPSNQASYFCVLSNASGSATSSVVSLTVIATPTIASISPASATVNAGQLVTFTLSSGSYPTASNFWYKEIPGISTNLISNGAQGSGSVASGATTTSLTLSNVLGGDTASYFAVLTNIYGSATSSLAPLTVIDPIIEAGPNSAFGLVAGTAQFAVTAAGTSPLAYRWYFSDTSGNIVAPVNNGTQGDGSGFAGVTSSTLSFTNLQLTDLTNFVVVVTNIYGAATSSVASVLSVSYQATLAFWDFNGSQFTNTALNLNCFYYPAPYLGVGTAQAVGYANSPVYPPNPTSLTASPFSGSVDIGGDGPGVDPYGITPPPPSYNYPADQPDSDNFSWGTEFYPANNASPVANLASNKLSGVQFNISTVGAKNITVAYDSRVSATASDYERLQYTTDGTTWIDYPISSTFAEIGTTYEPYSYNLTGFPGVANNPNFGIRIVTELENTATYGGYNDNNGSANKYNGEPAGGAAPTTNYIGTANTYGPSGTVTYDIVGFFGTAITNGPHGAYNPPTISAIANTNMVDTNTLVLPFTVGSGVTAPGSLVVSAQTLATPNQFTINPTLQLGGSGANRTLTISFASATTVPDPVDAAPIMVTVTDGNGDSTATWFDLVATSIYPPPTNSLTGLTATNMLANTALAIPFMVGSASTPIGSLTYSVTSDNNTLIPSANIVVTGMGSYTPTLTITPAVNQLGVALISVAVTDNNPSESHTTTANIAVMVRPNTNVVAVDYFDYDGSGALDTLGNGFWNHLSGNFGQMHVGSGVVTVDASALTENLQTPLLGAPYTTNSGAVLYASFTVNMDPTLDPTKMPLNNGTYITAFNDGTGLTGTADVNGLLVAATNGAAPGNYRLGIANIFGATALAPTVMFPQDLVPNTTNVVVLSLVLSNGFSTLWVNPISQSSSSVMNNSTVSGAVVLTNYNIVNFELRESGQPNGGAVNVGYLKVGTTFDSVFPSLQVQPAGTNVIVNWSDPTLGIQSTTNLLTPFSDVSGATPPYTNNASTNRAVFFRFGR